MGTYSEYLGRLGIIVDEVKGLLNDRTTTSYHTGLDIVGYCNRGLREIGAKGYFNDEITLSVVAGEESINLLTSIPGLVRVNAVRPADSRRFLKTYNNWPELDGSRGRFGFAASDTYGYFIDGRVMRFVNAPAATAGDLVVYYSYKPANLGKIIQCNSAAVTSKSGGTMTGIPATGHGELPGSQVTLYGSTKQNGTWTLDVSTTTNEMVIPKAYEAETLTATAKGQPVESYTPDWPESIGDTVLVYFATREAWGIDLSRDGATDQWNKYNGLYLAARADLFDVGDENASMIPSRG